MISTKVCYFTAIENIASSVIPLQAFKYFTMSFGSSVEQLLVPVVQVAKRNNSRRRPLSSRINLLQLESIHLLCLVYLRHLRSHRVNWVTKEDRKESSMIQLVSVQPSDECLATRSALSPSRVMYLQTPWKMSTKHEDNHFQYIVILNMNISCVYIYYSLRYSSDEYSHTSNKRD